MSKLIAIVVLLTFVSTFMDAQVEVNQLRHIRTSQIYLGDGQFLSLRGGPNPTWVTSVIDSMECDSANSKLFVRGRGFLESNNERTQSTKFRLFLGTILEPEHNYDTFRSMCIRTVFSSDSIGKFEFNQDVRKDEVLCLVSEVGWVEILPVFELFRWD